jgi:hypothetical protein
LCPIKQGDFRKENDKGGKQKGPVRKNQPEDHPENRKSKVGPTLIANTQKKHRKFLFIFFCAFLCVLWAILFFIHYPSEFSAHRPELLEHHPAFIQDRAAFSPDHIKFSQNHPEFNEDR